MDILARNSTTLVITPKKFGTADWLCTIETPDTVEPIGLGFFSNLAEAVEAARLRGFELQRISHVGCTWSYAIRKDNDDFCLNFSRYS